MLSLAGMNRIDGIFANLRSAAPPGKALMPFLTAGDPDVATTARLLPAIAAAGAGICELGIPFSDPVADGPVIQASMTRALDRKITVSQIFEAVAQQRSRVQMGLVAMVSYSIVYRLGARTFVQQAQQAGFDGFIFPDLPLEESAQVIDTVRDRGLICSLLIAPATPIERAEKIAAASSGFVYLLSRAGITGEQAALAPELPGMVERLRSVTDLPIAVGFGISSAQQVRQVVAVADAAIVGSAIVRRIAEHAAAGPQRVVEEVSRFVAELATGLGDQAPTTASHR